MKTIAHSFLFLNLLFLCLTSFGQEQQSQATYVENELIIWLEQGVDANDFALQSNSGITPKRLLSQRLNIWLFEIADKRENREAMMDRLWRNPNVRVVQNNHKNIKLRNLEPNDAYYKQQWAPAMINLPRAWETYGTGGLTAAGDTIVVAVVDEGACLDHEDLSFWKNRHEIPGNGIDDDGNGYVDDYDGWNAYDHNGTIPNATHGTHVTGIVGAIGNNGKGVCGVNWNVQVMPVASSAENESANEAFVVEAYAYVVEMRARYNETDGAEGAFIVVSNSSFGVDYGQPDEYPIWCSMYEAMGNVGILSSGSGPNQDVNVDEVGDIPSTCPSEYLIGINNSTQEDVLYRNTGYGIENIDIAAPGTRIYSTWGSNHPYSFATGTSMAAPHVSGTIALMYAAMSKEMIHECKHDPASFALLVKESLLEGADHLDALEGKVAGARRLNAYGAIEHFLDNWVPTLPVDDTSTVSFKVYPNPSTGLINLEGTGQLVVTNVLGQIVLTREMNGKTHITLPKGLYFARLADIVKKIVIK